MGLFVIDFFEGSLIFLLIALFTVEIEDLSEFPFEVEYLDRKTKYIKRIVRELF